MATLLKRKDVDLTSGVIWKQLLTQALPLMFGNLFQQLYNTVDSVVVGRFVGKEALAAVGSCTPIINTMIGFFSGLATGAGIVISFCYGAKNRKGIHDAVHTAIFITLLMAVLVTGGGILSVPLMLKLMSMPEDVMEGATTYLVIIFSGLIGLMFYNMGTGILRAVGDTRRPLYFLILSTLINSGLDLLFVLVFGMGIAGVALATVISQLISAVLVIGLLMRQESDYKLKLSEVRFEKGSFKQILLLGIPTAFQLSITSFSNVFVQGYVNYFGSSVMAGWTSYLKVDQFLVLPVSSMSLALTTFAGQNFGAGKIRRMKQGTWTAFFMAEAITLTMTVTGMIFAPELVKLFNSDAEVVSYGTRIIRMMFPFYAVFVGAYSMFNGTVRGSGQMRMPMLSTLLGLVVSRQIYLFIISRVSNTLDHILIGYPLGWAVVMILSALYYFFGNWDHHRIVKKKRSSLSKEAILAGALSERAEPQAREEESGTEEKGESSWQNHSRNT